VAARGYNKFEESGSATPVNSSSLPKLEENYEEFYFCILTYTDESNIGTINLLFWLVGGLFFVCIFELFWWDVSSLSTSYSLNVVVLPSWFYEIKTTSLYLHNEKILTKINKKISPHRIKSISLILPNFVDQNLLLMNFLDFDVINPMPHLLMIHLVKNWFVQYHDKIDQN
jgi:hypothetical protein